MDFKEHDTGYIAGTVATEIRSNFQNRHRVVDVDFALSDLVSPERTYGLSEHARAARVELITRAAANLGFELVPAGRGEQ